VGRGAGEDRREKDQYKIVALFAGERCSRAILNIIATTDVGRLAPKPAEEEAQSELSEWELRERNERDSMCP